MHGLDRLSKPTVAYVHGAAYGGGVGLVACCDIAIATERASFCLSEAKLGIIPAVIGPFVIRAIGARQARRYALTAEVIFARTAREIGLVHEAASEEEAPALCEKIVAALLRCAPGAQAEAKSLVSFCQGPRDRRRTGARDGPADSGAARLARGPRGPRSLSRKALAVLEKLECLKDC